MARKSVRVQIPPWACYNKSKVKGVKQAFNMAEKILGKVIHYYDKIGVAVIRLEGKVSVGDMIKIARGEEEFEEKISSMQIEHENVDSAKKGDEVAIKVSQRTKEGAVVKEVE